MTIEDLSDWRELANDPSADQAAALARLETKLIAAGTGAARWPP